MLGIDLWVHYTVILYMHEVVTADYDKVASIFGFQSACSRPQHPLIEEHKIRVSPCQELPISLDLA